jgi:hypothetical protein
MTQTATESQALVCCRVSHGRHPKPCTFPDLGQPAVKFTTVAEALKRPLNLGVKGGSVPVCVNGICPSGSALMQDSIFQSRGHLGDEPTRGTGSRGREIADPVIIGDVPEVCRCGTRKRRLHLLKDEARRDHACSGFGTL